MQRGGVDVIPKDTKALATKFFERFFAADTFEETLTYFNEILRALQIRPGRFNQFYPVIRQSIIHNSAQALFRHIDERRKNPVYQDGQATAALTTLVVGCGPCGLRTAIEAQLMGAQVVMLEKRTSFTRNNVLHIWPFVIEDLKMLGVKIFFPKFCTGAMNHISIRRLQAVLAKVALLLGVEIHLGVAFNALDEPRDPGGFWRVRTSPHSPRVTSLAVDVLVGAEGKHVTVPGFPRKEFRGKLAIAITANFVNNNTTAEAVVEEISGVAFVYKQDFFNALYDELGIALENIVYYKDETHYFVMTTKKHSLLTRGVLKKDYKDPMALLKQENINKSALMDYIRDTCDYCTDYQLPNLQFALNHHGEPDVALFDFTSMFAARNSIHVRERHSKQLLSCLVGDGLLEPFWPTGTGCARGFLGAFDACWAMRNWCAGEKSVLQVLAEREAVFKMLAQTTPENIGKSFRQYTIDPATRYTHIDYRLMSAQKVLNLYDSDASDNGWRPPIMQHHQQRINFNLRSQPGLQYDFNYLEGKAAEMGRQLCQLEPKRMKETVDLNLRSCASSLVAPDKPSIHEKPRKEAEAVGRLTEEKLQVLRNPPERMYKSKLFAEPPPAVGKLTEDKLAVLKNPEQRTEMQERKRLAEKKAAADRAISKLALRPDEDHVMERIRQQREREERQREEEEKRRRKKRLQNDVVDMELDEMLVQLETDDEFQRLTDNEKMAWLESLFYLDTGPNSRSSSRSSSSFTHINAGRKKSNNSLKINNSSSATTKKTEEEEPKSVKPSQIAAAKKTGGAKTAEPPPGVNANLVSLAQSFFANENKPKKSGNAATKVLYKVDNNNQLQKQQQLHPMKRAPLVIEAKPEKEAQLLPERAFFEPSSPGAPMVEEDGPEFPPPPIPPRSSQTKTAMLRLMARTTDIMKK